MDDGLSSEVDEDHRGWDIAPDEEIPSYVFNNSPANRNRTSRDDDIAEDTSFISHGINRRRDFRIQEPVDMTPDAVGTIYNNVFHPEPQSLTPAYYKSERNRLTTFRDWRYQNVVRKEDLAKNGFIFTGSADKVRCAFCNGLLRQWSAGDNVEQEHRRNFPTCPFLCGQNVGNIPLEPGSNASDQPGVSNTTNSATVSGARSGRGYDIGPGEEGYIVNYTQERSCGDFHESDALAGRNNSTGDEGATSRGYSKSPRNPHMAVEPDRLATFSSWPAQMKQKPEELARAGLYYIGDGDRVKCFHCGGLLYNWDPEDDPFVEHARWFPECQYIKLVKGEKFVDDVQSGRETQDDVMQTPAVLAVLYEGHSVESVQRALAAMRRKNGASEVVTAQNLLTTIMELEDDERETVNQTQNGHASSEDLKRLQRENETLRDKQLCKICMERDVEVIFLPCKHVVCCASCSAAVRTCPVCRVPIKSIDKIFMV